MAAVAHLQFLKNKFMSEFKEAKEQEFTEFPLWLHFVEIFNVLEKRRVTSYTPIGLKNSLYELKFALADCVMLAEKERDRRITQNKKSPLLLGGCPPLHYVKKQCFLFKTKRKLVRIQKELIQHLIDVRPSLSSSRGLARVCHPTNFRHINLSLIHGFNDHLQKMEALLLQDTSAATNNFRVIGIVGMGGSGKTTLAQMVFRSPRVRERFSPMLWIELPLHQYPNPQLIVSSNLECIPEVYSNSDIISLSAISWRLFPYLDRKKYLIVVDIVYPTINNDFYLNRELGLESKIYLDFLGQCFPTLGGAAIILTSRTKEEGGAMMDKFCFADELCWYQLEPMLDKDSCWSIILDSIGEEISRHPILPKIKDYMVERCDGLPLAAKTLAEIISTKLFPDPSAIKMFRLIFNKPVAPTSEILKELRTYEGVYYADIVSDRNNQVEAGGSCNPRKVAEDLMRFSQAEITLKIDDLEEIFSVNSLKIKKKKK